MVKMESPETFRGSRPARQAARSEVLPSSLPPRGLCREVAAAYIGISGTKFDELVRSGSMPKPRIVGARRLWDRPELDLAFSNLPHADENGAVNPWDVVRFENQN